MTHSRPSRSRPSKAGIGSSRYSSNDSDRRMNDMLSSMSDEGLKNLHNQIVKENKHKALYGNYNTTKTKVSEHQFLGSRGIRKANAEIQRRTTEGRRKNIRKLPSEELKTYNSAYRKGQIYKFARDEANQELARRNSSQIDSPIDREIRNTIRNEDRRSDTMYRRRNARRRSIEI